MLEILDVFVLKATSSLAVSRFYFNETAFVKGTLLLINVTVAVEIARVNTCFKLFI